MQYMLTTIDNPFNPFDDYEHWLRYDEDSGYYTNQYLARVASYSPDLSDLDQELSILQAIDEIISENVLGIYRKVSKPYLNSSES